MVLERRYPNQVFYASPAIQSLPQFNISYGLARVARDSVFFSPSDIGPLPDDLNHSVSYACDLSVAYFCSEPVEIKPSPYQKIESVLRHGFDDASRGPLGLVAEKILFDVLDLASPSMRSAADGLRDRLVSTAQRFDEFDLDEANARRKTSIDLLVAREVARIDLGVEMVLAQPK